MIYKTVHRKQKFSNTNLTTKHGGNSCALERKVVPAPHVSPLCFSCYKSRRKSRPRKGQDCDYDKMNMSVVICDTYIPKRSTKRRLQLNHWEPRRSIMQQHFFCVISLTIKDRGYKLLRIDKHYHHRIVNRFEIEKKEYVYNLEKFVTVL
jgi:hypothetical protein